MPIIAPITLNLVEDYLNCRYKAYLRLAGQSGTKSNYEIMQNKLKLEVKIKSIERFFQRNSEQAVLRDVTLTQPELQKFPLVIFDARLTEGQFLIHFDMLQRVDGDSALGAFHYMPILFSENLRTPKTEIIRLEVLCLFLCNLQKTPPKKAIIYRGSDCIPRAIRIEPSLTRAKNFLDELIKFEKNTKAPRLVLNPHCNVCEFKSGCREEAIRKDDLSLLSGMREKEVIRYSRKGLFTLTQLSHTFRPCRKKRKQEPSQTRRCFELQALAIRDRRLYILGTPKISLNNTQIYVDIEGIPDEGFVYLIGVLVIESGSESVHSFWADNKEQEKLIFDKFAKLVATYTSPSIFCYGSYERSFIKRMQQYACRKKSTDSALHSLTNVLSIIYAHFYFPTYSNGLKEIAGCLGFSWRDSGASGLQSIVWRRRWDNTKGSEWKTKLLEYNLDDCHALRLVMQFLSEVCPEAAMSADPVPSNAYGLPVELVSEFDKLANPGKFGRFKFANADFEFINKRAYFDYQRERVFTRTNKIIKKHKKTSGIHKNRAIRPCKQVNVTASKCPICENKALELITTDLRMNGVETRNKRSFDLVITAAGVKRKVMEFRAIAYRCPACSHCFVPERYKRLSKHYHSLMSWAIYLHVAHHLSFGTLEILFEEFFGMAIHAQEIHSFKSLMAARYRDTFRRLLLKVANGTVLHVDETGIHTRGEKGYVWVFTNVEDVVYIYKPTRNGEFLHDLLREFKGVLVSDYYAAYDGLPCEQQKCLIHIIRDINQDILNNPYDDELRALTQTFGVLLRSIVETVDEHGLRKSFLHRHSVGVDAFFDKILNTCYSSDTARSLQQRLLKNKNKLFTFIRYDGVSWNNNNAENAIKQFACYREKVEGVITTSGLNDYLLLLSVYQTCKYKGVSFLKFLLSGQRDIDVFCRQRNKKSKKMTVQLYPKTFASALSAQRLKKTKETKKT